ncbi:MAG: TRAP transporter fused permease subunit [Pseudomonadota bacterium]
MIREPVMADPIVIAEGVDEEAVEPNRRLFEGWALTVIGLISVVYASFHMIALNGISISGITGIDLPFLPQLPLETWNFRIVHIAGALGLGFLLFSAYPFSQGNHGKRTPMISIAALALLIPALIALVTAMDFARIVASGTLPEMGGLPTWASFAGTELYDRETWWFGVPLLIATLGGISLGWVERRGRGYFAASDLVLALTGIVVAIYLLAIYGTAARNAVGTPFVPIGVAFAATAGTALILELTRRVAGLALVVITFIFLAYTFTAHLLPGILAVQSAYSWQRFFGHVYSDAGILGPTTAVSSTYIILFIIFAAFLQASKVGDYFVNFAFAAAGRARGGPAKVAIFASGLMGMINGTSAGNVVATGSLTIPLMKKIGYPPKSAGAIEAGASTGGQIMPPIMGAGAFIMAEITGIPYTEIAVAAIIPAVLYFGSIFFMVDFEARKLGMRGMREDELPKFAMLAKQVYLFIPIIILIVALFMGYSVIRAGTLATAAAAVVSWLPVLVAKTLGPAAAGATDSTGFNGMGVRSIYKAFNLAGTMSIQIIAVCACAGIIVGVISLTGVGARFSALLLGLADTSQLLALFFAMCISILLGMGMPTTAAYAVAASVVAPGLIQLGINPLTAHFFVFYYAVVSAITPPVALASYAAAGISGANPMGTSVTSFKIGLAAFIVPFMFFYNPALLGDGSWVDITRALITASIGVTLLSGAVQGYFFTGKLTQIARVLLLIAALFLIEGSLLSDVVGAALTAGGLLIARVMGSKTEAPKAAE